MWLSRQITESPRAARGRGTVKDATAVPAWRGFCLAQFVTGSSSMVFSFTDQGFQGLSNLLITLFLARALAVEEFASIGLMLGIYYVVFSFHRACIVLPFILETSGRPDRHLEELADWWGASLYFTVLAEGLLLAAAAAVRALAMQHPEWLWVANALFFVSVILPSMLAGEFGRRVFYQAGDARRAAAASMAYMVVGIGLAALSGLSGSPLIGALAFAAAGAASATVFLALVRPRIARLRGAFIRWRPHAGFSFWQSLSSTFYVLYTASAVVLVASFAGSTAAAVYTVVRTIVNPALSIVSAVDSLDKPRAARALEQGGIAALRSSIARTRHVLLALSGSFLAMVIVFASWILDRFFGAEYASNATAARILALGFLLMCLNQPSETMLLVLRSARLIFVVRFAAAVLAVIGVWLGARHAGFLGAATAIASVQFIALAALQVAGRIAARGWAPAQGGGSEP